MHSPPVKAGGSLGQFNQVSEFHPSVGRLTDLFVSLNKFSEYSGSSQAA